MEFSLEKYRTWNHLFSVPHLLCKWRYFLMWLVGNDFVVWEPWKSREASVGKWIDGVKGPGMRLASPSLPEPRIVCYGWRVVEPPALWCPVRLGYLASKGTVCVIPCTSGDLTQVVCNSVQVQNPEILLLEDFGPLKRFSLSKRELSSDAPSRSACPVWTPVGNILRQQICFHFQLSTFLPWPTFVLSSHSNREEEACLGHFGVTTGPEQRGFCFVVRHVHDFSSWSINKI